MRNKLSFLPISLILFFLVASVSFASCESVLPSFCSFFPNNLVSGCNSVPFYHFWCTSLHPTFDRLSNCLRSWFLFDFLLFFTIIYFFSGARTNAKTLKLSSGLECRKISKNVFFSFHWLSSSLSKTRFIWFTILTRSPITLYKLISHCCTDNLFLL